MDPSARKLGEAIYNTYQPIEDLRFAHYTQRRFIHLLKIAMLLAVYSGEALIKEVHLLRANALLANTERKMLQALGEYGKSKNSLVSNAILDFLGRNTFPKSLQDIHKAVRMDLNRPHELAEILQSLKQADKIQVAMVKGKMGYVRKIEMGFEWPENMLDNNWLLTEEFS